MEKKPLYRFLPGKKVFSVGFFGCNMRCPFCQNWEISQRTSADEPRIDPNDLVTAALESGCPALAFTYSEPTVHFEYLMEASALARAKGLRTVLVTNGNLEPLAARELLPHMDAVNLDIKCFSASVYQKILGGKLEAVLEFARIAADTSWLEVTTLVVPDLDDWDTSIVGIADFVAGLSPNIPLHLSAYHPAWHHRAAPTDPANLSRLGELAASRLTSVYLGNIQGEVSIDRCGSCGTPLVERRGYEVRLGKLAKADKQSSQKDPAGRSQSTREPQALCASCGHPEFFVLD